MNMADYIQLGILVAAIVSICISQRMDIKQRRTAMFAEYNRRYQEIFLNMPDDIYKGDVKVDKRTKKYMRMYFDLCSEEYHLWQEKIIPDKVWNTWVEGMQIACNHQIYIDSWKALNGEYNRDFWLYFERNVINHKPSYYEKKES